MRYRKRDVNGDYVFGHGQQDFLINSPEAVGQAIQTRLMLLQGEFSLDKTQGMPWLTKVVGYNTETSYDSVIRSEIADTQGVLSIVSYFSSLNRQTRALTVTCRVQTIYGEITITSAPVSTAGGFGIGPFGNTIFGS